VRAGGIVRHPAGGEDLRILLAACENDDALGVVEMRLPTGGQGPPLHVHPTHGEGFYVLAGELTVQVGEDVVTAGPGTWAFAPRDVAHTLANHGRATVRLLSVFAPGGFERRFERMVADETGGSRGAALAQPSEAEAATRAVGPPLRPSSERGRR
jgi:quercetin dioxygenase-like cupin family protein